MTQIVITSGDPAGCGPLITLGAVNELKKAKTDFFIVGDQKIFQKIPLYQKVKNRVHFINANTPGIERVTKGCISKEGGTAGLNYLKKALELVRQYKMRRLVTAPLSKEAVQLVSKDFSGHTEYLAEYFGVKHIAMMMVADDLKAVLFTRHVLLSKVPALIKKDELLNTFSLTYSALQKIFKIKKPKIAIASFNPHAGINTFMAKEERTVFTAIKQFKKPLSGPYPSDTLFLEKNLKKYDCIICLYHDQAMIPFKLLAVKEGVNLTLGLPIIRTSPAHGVAYDVMRVGKIPFHSSMVAAIRLAIKLPV